MVKKIKKYLKFVVCCALILSLIAPSYAALSASDGSAFVTKAEFDSALADFNARLTTFEAGINSKIDSQVTSYLDRNGIWNGKAQNFVDSTDTYFELQWSGGFNYASPASYAFDGHYLDASGASVSIYLNTERTDALAMNYVKYDSSTNSFSRMVSNQPYIIIENASKSGLLALDWSTAWRQRAMILPDDTSFNLWNSLNTAQKLQYFNAGYDIRMKGTTKDFGDWSVWKGASQVNWACIFAESVRFEERSVGITKVLSTQSFSGSWPKLTDWERKNDFSGVYGGKSLGAVGLTKRVDYFFVSKNSSISIALEVVTRDWRVHRVLQVVNADRSSTMTDYSLARPGFSFACKFDSAQIY